MSSLLRSWPWRTDDFVLDHEHVRRPALCRDPDGQVHAVWLHDSETVRHGQRITVVRHAALVDNTAEVDAKATSREPLLNLRAAWIDGALAIFALARHRDRWGIGRAGRSDRWPPVVPTERDVLAFDVAAGPDGRPMFAFQTWLDTDYQVYAQLGSHGRPMEVGAAAVPKWSPIVVPGRDGRFWVAWEACHAGRFRVFTRQIFPDGGMGPVLAAPAGDQFCLDPAGHVDAQGRLWLAWRAADAWGRKHHFLNGDAKLVLACVGTDRVLATYELPIPEDPDQVKLPASPTVWCHGDGGVSVFFRWFRNAMPNDWGWDVNCITLRDGEWSSVRRLSTAIGDSDERIRAIEHDGQLTLGFQACSYDGRRDPPYGSRIVLKRVRPAEVRVSAEGRVEESATRVTVTASSVQPSRPLGASSAGPAAVGGGELAPFWGDLHRHTNHSKCLSENDGSFLDHYRWAIETAALDFYAVTDHYSYINADDWAECLRLADLHNAPGAFAALLGYEWHHQGHANFFFTNEQAAGQVWRECAGLRTFAELYAAFDGAGLRGQVMAIRHYHADLMLATAQSFWPSVDRHYESAAEVVQTRGFSPLSYECLLSHGRRLGAVGASDHSVRPGVPGRSGPYVYAAATTGLYAQELSREAVFDAIRRRRTFATNGKKMAVWITVDDVFMGGEGVVGAAPEVKVHVDATTEAERVEIVRNGQAIAERTCEDESVEFAFTDEEAPPGEHYYYLKAWQKPDGVHPYPGQAWSSPVWATITG